MSLDCQIQKAVMKSGNANVHESFMVKISDKSHYLPGTF